LVPDLRWDAGAVVAHKHLDGLPDSARGHQKGRSKARFRALTLPLAGRVETVPEQVQEYPRHLLWRQFDLADVAVVVAVERNVERLILSTGAVIGEVQRLLDKAV